jgi:hypothetical protein
VKQDSVQASTREPTLPLHKAIKTQGKLAINQLRYKNSGGNTISLAIMAAAVLARG